MKPNELLENYKFRGHSKDESTLNRYSNVDVVTSYIKNSFGIVFLIKGKIKPFAFVVIKQELSYNYYNFKQISLKDFFNMRDNLKLEETIVMIDEEKEKKIKAIALFDELKG